VVVVHDLIIKGGTVVDGTGSAPFTADIAIAGDQIAEVGRVTGQARQTIDADGLLVTPGFVDVHTHYDGQITWDPLLTPSCWHGVTTVVMGNCGVGFAPVRPGSEDWLIQLMEGVEDIPGTALAEGITWGWETFPEYLNAVERAPKALDVGTQVPHGAVRAYVMGERGAHNEPATAEDIEAMADLVRQGVEAGALGFSTSRTLAHRAIDGEPVPGTFAAEDELFGIGRVLGELGRGVFELAPAGALGEDLAAPEREMAWMRKLATSIGRPVTFVLTQNDADPGAWRRLLALSAEAAEDGAAVRPQVHGRTVSLLLGHQTFHPFNFAPSWAEIALRAPAEQLMCLADPERRRRLVAEMEICTDPIVRGFMRPDRTFPLGDPPDYEPSPEASIAALAAREGRSPWEVLYDTLFTNGGLELLNAPVLNYTDRNLDAAREMLAHPTSAFGLGDGGAHAGQTCDASTTTFMLTHWARDRTHDRLPVEWVVKKMTSATASLFGLADRGVLTAGAKADVNLIDFDRLRLHRPVLAHDLPAGAGRLIQRADGYVATFVSGVQTLADGEETGSRPGVLIRGERGGAGVRSAGAR
jgi:N-acyl-D-aspartate/D-glutamate deacylase